MMRCEVFPGKQAGRIYSEIISAQNFLVEVADEL